MKCERCKIVIIHNLYESDLDDTFPNYTLCRECGAQLDEIIENWIQDSQLNSIIKDILKERYKLLEKLEDNKPDDYAERW